MSVLVVGLNHHSTDLALLDRLAVPTEELPKALASVVGLEHVLEAVVLSTCNRVEIYAHVSRFHPGLQELRAWLAERGDVHPQDLDDLHYAYHDDHAAAHLFAVAAGLDSMVVGERQIALQVKQAAETARDEGTSRRVLQKLFREAVRVGRQVRNETDISAGASSMVDVGLEMAARSWDSGLAGRTVLVVGAGKIGSLTAGRLHREGVGSVLVWNRSLDKAERLASKVDGEPVGADGFVSALAQADLVVCTTGAPEPILDAGLVSTALGRRDQRPLVLLDLAMPRNVDPACLELPAVRLLDVEAMRSAIHSTVAGEAMDAARAIVDEEARRFSAWTRAVRVEPTIRALRQRAEIVREGELERLRNRLADLDEDQRDAVEALSRGIVNTLLHEPTVRLKDLADTGGAEHAANALRELFDLDEDV